MTDRVQRTRAFLADLKRRRVYHVAAIYLVAAAGGIQLVDVVVPATRLPEWSSALFLALVVLGFPLVLVLAWAFDVTPEGLRRTTARVAEPEPEHAAAGGAPDVHRARDGTRLDEADLDPRALAVLPFDNISGSADAEPLAAGLHDDLLTALSKVSGLTVISRTSVRGYRGTEKRVPQIARELNVGTIIEGGIQTAGGRVRLNVQLIDARHDVHRWAETYDRKLSTHEIFDIQTELAARIVASLHAELAAPEGQQVRRAPTADMDAYRLHAQARSDLERRTKDALQRALDGFARAVGRDPGYALAWAGLAETLLLFEFYALEAPAGTFDAEHAARHALELDPRLAEAHTSLGILYSMRHDGADAIGEFLRAIELQPGYADAHVWLSWTYLMVGQPAEALEPARRGAELNPRAPAVRVYLAEALLANGEVDAALAEARRATQLEPEYGLAHFMTGVALCQLGAPAEARSVLAATLPLVHPAGAPSHAEVRAVLALTHAAEGDTVAAREQLAAMANTANPFATGIVHAALHELDHAFEHFARVEEWGSPATEQFRYFFPELLRPLRRDPRFRRVLDHVDRSWGSPALATD